MWQRIQVDGLQAHQEDEEITDHSPHARLWSEGPGGRRQTIHGRNTCRPAICSVFLCSRSPGKHPCVCSAHPTAGKQQKFYEECLTAILGTPGHPPQSKSNHRQQQDGHTYRVFCQQTWHFWFLKVQIRCIHTFIFLFCILIALVFLRYCSLLSE